MKIRLNKILIFLENKLVMKRKFILIFSSIFLLNSCDFSLGSKLSLPKCNENSKKLSIEKIFNDAKKGVVVISTDNSTGSGFVVGYQNDQTLILTNSHVIKGNNKVLVNWFDGNEDIGWKYQDSFDILSKLISELNDQGFPNHAIYILGFSQGACLSMEFMIRQKFM